MTDTPLASLRSKLTSRKLWAALAAFAVTLITAFLGDRITPDASALIERGVSALCCYIFGEAGVDIARLIWEHR